MNFTNLFLIFLLLQLCSASVYYNESECGTFVPKKHRNMGGKDVEEGEYPFIVGIFNKDEYICAGTLISQRHVLTAAHCFASSNKETYLQKKCQGNRKCLRKYLGNEETERCQNGYLNSTNILQDYKIGFNSSYLKEMKKLKLESIDQSYQQFYHFGCLKNDLAILTLALDGNETQRPYICLPHTTGINIRSGIHVSAFGWGEDPIKRIENHEILQKLSVGLWNMKRCLDSVESWSRFPVDGICVEESNSKYTCRMNEYPINHEWTISEDRLRALKDSLKNGRLRSDKFTAFRDSDVQYSLRIYPNGNKEKRRGQAMIYLHIELGNEKQIDVDCIFSIKSAKWSHTTLRKYEKSTKYGITCCTVDELFDSEKKFFVDGKLTIIFQAIFKIANSESEKEMKLLQTKWKYSNNFGDLWDKNFKDCTLFVDGKEIKAHKCVIGHHFSVFAEILESKSEIIIDDIPLEEVEMFLKHCYNRFPVSEISPERALSLLNFAEKYAAEELKENLEEFLAAKLTPLNLCKIIESAISENALKLHNKCLDFFVECLSRKYFLPNTEILKKEFLISVFTKFSCQQNRTENAGPPSEEFMQTKWKTTENFRSFWNIGRGDCIIIVDGKEINAHKIVLGYHSQVFDAIFEDEFERKVEISGFPLEIVEKAIKLFYDKTLVSEISVEDSILLYKFAVKYEAEKLKDNLEEFLAAKLTPSNVSKIMKCATEENAFKLQCQCREYFFKCLSKKEFVSNMELLDKNVFITTIEKFCCQYSQIL